MYNGEVAIKSRASKRIFDLVIQRKSIKAMNTLTKGLFLISDEIFNQTIIMHGKRIELSKPLRPRTST